MARDLPKFLRFTLLWFISGFKYISIKTEFWRISHDTNREFMIAEGMASCVLRLFRCTFHLDVPA